MFLLVALVKRLSQLLVTTNIRKLVGSSFVLSHSSDAVVRICR